MIYRYGDTSVDTLRAEILRAGETVPLRRKSFDVLVYLLHRPRRVVTKAELLDAVWHDRIVTEGSLKSCLTEVRAAIGDHERKLIRTVPGRGYMLEAPFESELPAADTRTSILVAPIEDQGLGRDSAYIADGLTEEIIVELSKVQSFRVISHASVMRLKGMGGALEDHARRLAAGVGVHHLDLVLLHEKLYALAHAIGNTAAPLDHAIKVHSGFFHFNAVILGVLNIFEYLCTFQ